MNKALLILFVFAVGLALVVGMLVYNNSKQEKQEIVQQVQEDNQVVQDKITEILKDPVVNITKVVELNTTVTDNSNKWTWVGSGSSGSYTPSPGNGY